MTDEFAELVNRLWAAFENKCHMDGIEIDITSQDWRPLWDAFCEVQP